MITSDSSVEKILNASLTTLKDKITEFRVPAGISYYCLKHKVQSSKYHSIHIKQLNIIFKITGDSYFKQMADNFYSDYH